MKELIEAEQLSGEHVHIVRAWVASYKQTERLDMNIAPYVLATIREFVNKRKQGMVTRSQLYKIADKHMQRYKDSHLAEGVDNG